METKYCSKCGDTKPLDGYHKDKSKKDGLSTWCKSCKGAVSKAYYEKYPAIAHAASKRNAPKWRNGKGRARVLEHARATRARRRVSLRGGDHILITDLYVRDEGICGICERVCDMDDASVDHIRPISKQGKHVWDNVQLAHLQCNRLNGATL